jgi:predicted nuclease of predicted toxin-antitoxin system
MNFLADESVDRPIVDRLRQEGHQVWSVAEMEPGLSDDAVLDWANREGAWLLTADKDFGELIFRQGRIASGVVLVRLAGLSPARKAEVAASAIAQHAEELRQGFTVIMPGAVRVRRLRVLWKGSAAYP